MTKLEQLLRKKVRAGKKIVCAYITLGYPSLGASEKLIRESERIGVDVIELGFPFSDPMADGPTIQKASDYSLRRHVKLNDAFSLVAKLRKSGVKIPILFFSYFNPILHHGLSKMAGDLKKFGFDGAIVPDLPPQEGADCKREFVRRKLSIVNLVAPTTKKNRMRMIAKASEGFVYYVSLRGVTGTRRLLDPEISNQVRALKKVTSKPVLVGFGVSNAEHVKTLCKFSDGVIVGSAIINQLSGSDRNLNRAVRFIESLVRAARLSS